MPIARMQKLIKTSSANRPKPPKAIWRLQQNVCPPVAVREQQPNRRNVGLALVERPPVKDEPLPTAGVCHTGTASNEELPRVGMVRQVVLLDKHRHVNFRKSSSESMLILRADLVTRVPMRGMASSGKTMDDSP